MSENPTSGNDTKLDLMYDASTTNRPGSLFQIHKSQHTDEFSNFVTPVNNMVIGQDGRYSCTSRMMANYERDHWWIPMDHCYARPWNWRPESTFLKPTKTLFMPKQVTKKKSTNPLAPVQECEELIDIESEPDQPAPVYDKIKAKHLMEECEKYAASVKPEEGSDDWEDNISKINWTSTQNRLFNVMVNILNTDHLSRLSCVNSASEAITRRVTVDKSVERFRRLMASVSWDSKYTVWLHQLLLEALSKEYLGIYLDILQTLRSKLPTLVDKLLSSTTPTSKLNLLSFEHLFPLMKRPWDPVGPSLIQEKPKKLPGNPLIVVLPSSLVSSKRMLKWINFLSTLSTVVPISTNFGGPTSHKASVISCLDQMFVVARNKIQDLRMDYIGRNIILVGFGFGATLALQVAQVEQVLGVVCVGFSLHTADGRRGEQDDNLMELQCPVLFVIGQCSNTSLQEDMENLRERMRVETGLIVVGSADDNLRISKKKKKAEGITQSIVDRCITEEIGEFISGIILSPYPPQIRQSPTNLTTDGPLSKKLKTERKRYNSNTSSLDSEPPSPTPRLSRPGQNNSSPSLGRPPGSKTKTKLDAKWAAQGTSPSPSSSPPHPQTLSTPDTSSNDSTLTDKFNSDHPPIKKIKTLKPTVNTSPDKSNTSSNQNITSTKTHTKAKAINLQNRSLSSLLQGDIPRIIQNPVSKSGSSGIKVLENVKLTGGIHPKFLSNSTKIIDMSKISVLNTKGSSGSSIVLLPDGKIKNLSTNVKNQGGRYITSKRQLMGNKPPKPVKKMTYLSQPATYQSSSLPPPTNLTTQDIMDLPIIFADDNQVLEGTISQPEVKPPQPQIVVSQQPKMVPTTSSGKFMVINKQSNFIIAPSSDQKIAQQTQLKSGPKYTKIILSSKRNPADELKSNTGIVAKISNLSSEISIKKVVAPETVTKSDQQIELDLENEIVASTLYKPSSKKANQNNITIVSSKPIDDSPPYAEEIPVSSGLDEKSEQNLENNRGSDLKRPAKEEVGEGNQYPPSKIPKVD